MARKQRKLTESTIPQVLLHPLAWPLLQITFLIPYTSEQGSSNQEHLLPIKVLSATHKQFTLHVSEMWEHLKRSHYQTELNFAPEGIPIFGGCQSMLAGAGVWGLGGRTHLFYAERLSSILHEKTAVLVSTVSNTSRVTGRRHDVTEIVLEPLLA